MRVPLSSLADKSFDVAVIGCGANGASAAHHLAAAGYSVVAIDKGDFAEGASSRSSRLLHCGIRFLEPKDGLGYMNPSMWDFVKDPGDLLHRCRRVRDTMALRNQFLDTMPERFKLFTFGFPTWQGENYRPWHIDAGFKLLELVSPGGHSVNYKRLSKRKAQEHPMFRHLRDQDRLLAVGCFEEYRYEWAERIVMDTVLDAQRLGAIVRNYTKVTKLARNPDEWVIRLAEMSGPPAEVEVKAKIVLNMTGTWIDSVNKLSGKSVRKKIRGTKGCHIMVQLPTELEPFGVCTSSSRGEQFYVIPWRGLHYFGSTDTLYEGDLDNISATKEEVEGLVYEANRMLPTLNLKTSDVLFSWAGVRPLTNAEGFAQGKRGRHIHELETDGLPDMFAVSGSPIQVSRGAGSEICAAVAQKLKPSGKPKEISYAAKSPPKDETSPPLLNSMPSVTISDLRHAASTEQPTNLADLLFRRVGIGWTATMGVESSRRAAEAVSDILGWDPERIDREVTAYREYVTRLHGAAAAARA